MYIENRTYKIFRVSRVPETIKANNKININDYLKLDKLLVNDNISAFDFTDITKITLELFKYFTLDKIIELKFELISITEAYIIDKEFKISEKEPVDYIDDTQKKVIIANPKDVRLKLNILYRYKEWLNTTDFSKLHLENKEEINEGKNSELTLSNLITHKKSTEIVEFIKVQYKNINGKQLKILLLALQNLGLIPEERIAKKFHECCKKEFNWKISSYNAMNGYNYNEITDKIELNKKIEHIKSIIQ